MPGTKATRASLRVLAPTFRIISSVMSVTGTGASSMDSACWEAVVMVAALPARMRLTISVKRGKSL